MWIICAIIVVLALVADFVSTAVYSSIFLWIVVSDLIAIAILVRLAQLKKFSQIGIGLLGLVAAFTLLDVGLRSTLGVRVLDAIL
jgi:hypothetical protein